jgi:hypothetical protein
MSLPIIKHHSEDYKEIKNQLSGIGGVMVRVTSIATKVCRFNPSQGRQKSAARLPSEGK